jgi:hypothetical protein
MKDQRGSWYLLTGLVLGLIIGFLYSAFIDPVRYIDTAPAALRISDKDAYRQMVALAYAADANLARAQSRLSLLGESDVSHRMVEQARQLISYDSSSYQGQALERLAAMLSGQLLVASTTAPTFLPDVQVTEIYTTPNSTSTLEPGDMTKTPVIGATITPTASLILTAAESSPTVGPPFVLQDMTKVCTSTLTEPLLQIQAIDSNGQQVPGIEIIVSWVNGEDHFYTGLKPEIGLGYADFKIAPDIKYTVRLADGGQPVADLSVADCTDSEGKPFIGGWFLVFNQP